MYPKSLVFGLLLMLGLACSKPETADKGISTADLPAINFTPAFTMTEAPDEFFQQITDVKSDLEGNIYILDQRALKIHIYDAEGNYLTSVGRSGSGPGEFQSILDLFIDADNSIYAFDPRQARNVIFSNGGESWETNEIFMIEGSRFNILSADTLGNLALTQGVPGSPKPGVFWYEMKFARGDLDEGLIEDDLFRVKQSGNLVTEDFNMIWVPFGRRTYTTTDIFGHVYLAWNEGTEVTKYNAQMEPVDSLNLNIPNQPLSRDERREAIDELSDQFRTVANEHIPETKPAFYSLHVDPRGRFWVQTYDSPEFAVFDKNGDPLGSFDLPEDRYFMHADTHHVYLMERNEEGTSIHVLSHDL